MNFMAINKSPVVCERNADLELSKISFKGTKPNKMEAFKRHKMHNELEICV